ncbi:hypothetical protein QVZ41_13440 [Wenyingzhuangia sp. chi5]|uniref:Zinc ribbon domain-containing protein n=1 Tax=Wenyingzhuangia gilva TaxID=3057677 RepID=A0ABT8VV50_9FLAO|nr:hypothetical protein [Wenyingzhuangia sp. chi5]MDO3695848.1 hypothetical protein [Wenyingzhuangia sp. chi5]
MKFIKCESCHHYNPIKSEYQIFCDACGKKISNNFKAWQQKYPNKNLEDYKIAVGVDKQATKPKPKKISLKKILQITFIVICSSIGAYFGKQQSSKLYSFFHELAYPTSELLKQDWKRQYFANKKASLESPYLLTKETAELALPDEVKQLVLKMSNYTYTENPNYSIALTVIEYNQAIENMSLKAGSDGSITEVLNRTNGTDLYYSDSDTFINQYPALVKKGNFKSDGNEIYFKSITCSRNNKQAIHLIALWIGKNEDYELITERLFNSFDVR